MHEFRVRSSLTVLIFCCASATLTACAEGAAVVAQCSDTSACPAGSICNQGVCTALCNDNSQCARDERCDGGTCVVVANPECRADEDCASPGPCQVAFGAACNAGRCIYAPKAELTACSDDNPCTSGDLCNASGVCTGTPRACDTPPYNECQTDNSEFVSYPSSGYCDTANGECVYDANIVPCAECATTCREPCPSSAVVCNERNGGCTFDGVCVPATSECRYTITPDLTPCDLQDDASGPLDGTCNAGECVECTADEQCRDRITWTAYPGCYDVACVNFACVFGLQPSRECEPTQCSGGQVALSRVCGSLDEALCPTSGSVSCEGFDCDPTPDLGAATDMERYCLEQCDPVLQTGCAGGLTCDGGGECPPPKNNNEDCNVDGECASGRCECADATCGLRKCSAADCTGSLACNFNSDGDTGCEGTLQPRTQVVGECVAPFACFAGACKKDHAQNCAQNSDCGGICVNSVCQEASLTNGTCDEVADCPAAPTHLCSTGSPRRCKLATGQPCTGNEQCEIACIAGFCATSQSSTNGTCEEDGDCLSPGTVHLCVTGQCRKVDTQPCAQNSQCQNTCIGGQCAARAATNGSCDSTDGSADCAASPSHVCAAGSCLRPNGTVCGGSGGPASDALRDAQCESGHCINASASSTGLCGAQVAVGLSCDTGADCQTGLCSGGACKIPNGQSCSANNNGGCEGGRCANGTCGAPQAAYGSCDEPLDCQTGHTCTANVCRRNDGQACPANDNGSCLNGRCRNGICGNIGGVTDACDEAGDCAGALSCTSNTCRHPDGATCSGQNGWCVNTCLASTCAPRSAALGVCDSGDDNDCGTGLTCVGTVCKKDSGLALPCAADSECTDGACLPSGVCAAPATVLNAACNSDGDCSVGAALGCRESAGQCRKANGETCVFDTDCGETCNGITQSGGWVVGTCATRTAVGAAVPYNYYMYGPTQGQVSQSYQPEDCVGGAISGDVCIRGQGAQCGANGVLYADVAGYPAGCHWSYFCHCTDAACTVMECLEGGNSYACLYDANGDNILWNDATVVNGGVIGQCERIYGTGYLCSGVNSSCVGPGNCGCSGDRVYNDNCRNAPDLGPTCPSSGGCECLPPGTCTCTGTAVTTNGCSVQGNFAPVCVTAWNCECMDPGACACNSGGTLVQDNDCADEPYELTPTCTAPGTPQCECL